MNLPEEQEPTPVPTGEELYDSQEDATPEEIAEATQPAVFQILDDEKYEGMPTNQHPVSADDDIPEELQGRLIKE